jgi:hypothetical protein
MATMEELYQQYLLTQPGIGGSQNRYRDLISQTQPFVNPYGTMGSYRVRPGSTTRTVTDGSMGNYSGGGGGDGGSGSGSGTTTRTGTGTTTRTGTGTTAGTGTFTGTATQRGLGGTGSVGTNDFVSAWETMTDAEKAAFYAENPTLAAITQFGQNIFGRTSLGMAQNYFVPDFVSNQGLIARGIDPATYQAALLANRGSELLQGSNTETEYPDPQDMLDSFNAAYAENAAAAKNAETRDAAEARDAASFAGALAYLEAQQGAAQENSGSPDSGTTYESTYEFIAEQPGTPSPDSGGYNASDYGGYTGSETQSSGEAYANYKGGLVDRVAGPNPPGPDDGAGLLQLGEYVIKKSAVKKYGEGLLGMINAGKIPAKKMKSLLG